MEQTKKNHLNFAAILFWIIAACTIPTVIDTITMLTHSKGIGIISILSTIGLFLFFVAVILLGYTCISMKTSKSRKLMALLAFIGKAVFSVISLYTIILQVTHGNFDMMRLILRIVQRICEFILWLFVFTYYTKGEFEPNTRIKNVFNLSMAYLVLYIVLTIANAVTGRYPISFRIGGIVDIILTLLVNLLPIFAMLIFSSPGYRVPVNESAKVKKLRNAVIAIVIIAVLVWGVSALLNSSKSNGYMFSDIDKNNSGDISGKEWSNALDRFMTEQGY